LQPAAVDGVETKRELRVVCEELIEKIAIARADVGDPLARNSAE
jgi:hypothetical protein